ncbi:inositol-3-phosphate synthase [Methermicoccus shengliensis]|uniref:Inositol-3-phosphate synthase n=1 Tax=Methermicoccus shengliensis TaxID=660064 RepID=A0A832RWP1_9EURY|nr:inositol-3-phosphate synthase [Methermicoccus shengliensis]KUK05241.1 MAG: Myo-inositol-1-phosphate synthase [Euryarchaeota archaeon 55_53]KUK30344.1 MAG: Myo-inositol-1-phosphate synthase [Methanosarcinales archeaon 56_1174]MDI3487828.1 myo-inositol-phosphate synthase [Methanosarcinales archaeon]MDN5294525.1 myo-inositol-phosphate synthase [Methanosarcinales archaeon]HIH69746.1 inositol-3-phosphate synthase [Methermicoccus shengliensis]
MSEVRTAIAGVGNCASSLIQGLSYYRDVDEDDGLVPGLMHNVIAGYRVRDVRPVAAFDVDVRKVGKDLSQAIFEKPNCTKKFCDVEPLDVEVMKAPPLDGVAPHMEEWFKVDDSQPPVDVAEVLKETRADVLINYLPVGSEQGARWYAERALEAGCAFVNCIPAFIASDPAWAERFAQRRLPIIGDDIKSMVGATIVHRVLTQMIVDRGANIRSTYQLNVGGNTDFLNMVDSSRLSSKRTSKTESIASQIPYDAYVYAGPNGHVACLNDNKICYLRIDFDLFGDVPASIDLKLSVEDSPNSAGVVIDAVRIAKLALDRGVGGALKSASAYFMKHPPVQMREPEARAELEQFIQQFIQE